MIQFGVLNGIVYRSWREPRINCSAPWPRMLSLVAFMVRLEL